MQIIWEKIRPLKTCNLYLSFLTIGLLVSITGPSILDLQNLISTDAQHISLIYIARYVGYIVGALSGGVILDLIQYRQAVLSLCCFVAGCTTILVPWSGGIVALITLMAFNGMFLGILETGATVICLNLWGESSAPVYQGLHFTFALGGLISPLIAAPFLEFVAADVSLVGNVTLLQTSLGAKLLPVLLLASSKDQSLAAASNLTVDGAVPGIAYPYSIAGFVSCLTGVLFLVIAVLSPTEDSIKEDARQNNGERTPGFMASVSLLTFLLIFAYCAMENGYAQMLTTYCVKGSLHLTVQEGSYLTSAFWGAFAASRLASVLLAMRFGNLTLIMADLIATSAAVLLVLCFSTSHAVLWVATITFGAGIGSFFASVVGLVNEHVRVTNRFASVITAAASFGGMATPFIISFFVDEHPDIFAQAVACTCLVCWLIVLATQAFFRRFGSRTPPEDRQMKSKAQSGA